MLNEGYTQGVRTQWRSSTTSSSAKCGNLLSRQRSLPSTSWLGCSGSTVAAPSHAPGTSGDTVTTDMTTLTPGSGLPLVGPPSTIVTDTQTTTTGNTKVDNNAFNSTLFGIYKTTQVKSADLRKKIKLGTLEKLPPSRVSADSEMCLAWHTKGICNSNCPRKADHVTYTAAEYTPMVNWCRDHGYKQE